MPKITHKGDRITINKYNRHPYITYTHARARMCTLTHTHTHLLWDCHPNFLLRFLLFILVTSNPGLMLHTLWSQLASLASCA